MPNFLGHKDRARQLEIIERIYLRGRRRYVRLWSLIWGSFMFFCMTALDIVRRPNHQFKGLWEVLWLLLSLSLWLTVGYLVGAMMWRGIERKRKKLSQDD